MLSFKTILQLKIVFTPPKRSKILIYDNHSITNGNVKVLFGNTKKEVFFCRYEKLNLYILFKALFFPKYTNLKDNYKYHYLKNVSPKIVFTAIDNNPAFYLLKDIYPSATYIADQNSVRDNNFYDYCLREKNNKNIKFKCDFFFVFGKYEENRIRRIINTKVITLGSTTNNFYFKKEKRKKEKTVKRVIYISSKIRLRPALEKKYFSHLLNFCKKFNYKLFFLDRVSVKGDPIFTNNKTLIEKTFGKQNCKYLQIKDYKKKMNFLKNSELITFMHSTLGYQCLINGFKTFSFGHHKYNYSGQLRIKKEGLFWYKTDNYNILEKKLLKILAIKKPKWEKIINRYSKNILIFKKNNKEKLMIIKSILKKTNLN